jgi:SEC-C motif
MGWRAQRMSWQQDLCPCGSSKKFKKCCLTAAADETAIGGEQKDELKTDAAQATSGRSRCQAN